MNSILAKIVARKREEISALPDIRLTGDEPPVRDFHAALTGGDQRHRVSLIAEVKKASPSKGVIRADFNPVEIARAYQAGGANCLSVLTDEFFFQGHLDYLTAIRAEVDLPILRKDFILDPKQVYQARATGADAVLLIAECLEPETLKQLHELTLELGMTPLVELYEPANIDAVLACQPALVGVNNRDLNTFEVDLQHCLRVKERLPADIALVGESGISSPQDIQLMQDHGVAAVLVGESLMRSNDIAAAVTTLMAPARDARDTPATESTAPPEGPQVTRPADSEYHEFYRKYVAHIPDEATFAIRLLDQVPRLRNLLGKLPTSEFDQLHEPFTWTLKQVVGHLIDTERIFSDRMLRIGVGDQTPIPGIDQQMFVRGVNYTALPMPDLLDELEHLRIANQLAVKRLTDNDWIRVGTASDSSVTARANIYILVGHFEHHLDRLKTRLQPMIQH